MDVNKSETPASKQKTFSPKSKGVSMSNSINKNASREGKRRPMGLTESPNHDGDKKAPVMLDQENMQRLLKSQEGKKPIAVLKSQTQYNAMNGYAAQQAIGVANTSPKSGARTGDMIPPISAGEQQRSLINGRGQYYKNYQNIALTNIGVMQPGQQANISQLMNNVQPKEASKNENMHSSYQTEFQNNLEINEENRKPFNMAAISGFKGTGSGSGVSELDGQNSYIES